MYLPYYFLHLNFFRSLVIICTYVFIHYICIIFAFLTAQYYELNARENL